MAREVDMWCAVMGDVAGADDCFTTGLFDCVALALRGESSSATAGYYFGHLTSHQMEKMTDTEGNAVRMLRQFFAAYPRHVRVRSAVNYQPEVDWTQRNLESMRPTSIAGNLAALLRQTGPDVARTVEKMKYLAVTHGGATVTLDVARFELHCSRPENRSLLNNVYHDGNYADYITWSYPEIAAEQERRRALREQAAAAKKSFCTIL